MDPSLLPEGHGMVMQTADGEFVPVYQNAEEDGEVSGASSSGIVHEEELGSEQPPKGDEDAEQC